jgi:hypothetical protein
MNLMIFLVILVFLIGIYFYAKGPDIDGFQNNSSAPRCPNLLIQKGSNFYLYNSKLAKVPGVNPIEFDNLEDYTEFLDWQRSQNIRCPVLYLQETFDAQGNVIYKTRPGVSDLQGGLPPSINPSVGIALHDKPLIKDALDRLEDKGYPNTTLLVDATRNDPSYNIQSYPAYDDTSYYVGTTTPLEMMNMEQEKQKVSPDPMDPNWGGAEYTQTLVDQGYYAGNEVQLPAAS